MPDSALLNILAGTTPATGPSDFLSTATNAFVIISVIVAIVALGWAFRTRRNVVEIQNYKALAESYEKVTKAQKAEIEELQRARAEDTREIQELRGKVETLTEILTGKTVVDDLAKAVDRLEAVTGKIEDLTRRGAP